MVTNTFLSPPHGPVPSHRLDTAVREIMRPGVIVLSDDASVAQSQRALVSHGVHAVLVLERLSGRPVGWITTRGLLSWCERDVTLARAGGAVSEPVVTIRPSASAREALLTLEREGATRLLVSRQSDGLPEGVVADIDLLRLVAR